MTAAPLAVPVEVRLTDSGPRLERVFRLAAAIAPDALQLARPVPFEQGRAVAVELTLPGDQQPLAATGRVTGEGHVVQLLGLDPEPRERIQRYVQERNET